MGEESIQHMKKHHLFGNKQFGFLSGRSTVLQLLIVLDIWTEILENRGGIDVVYCDFKKAFDKVPHQQLLKKVEAYGIMWKFTTVDTSFLLGRQQRVQVQGTLSKQHQVTSGIPQGTVRGQLLFVIFINDMPDEIIHSYLYLFADDTKLFKAIHNITDCELLQDDREGALDRPTTIRTPPRQV